MSPSTTQLITTNSSLSFRSQARALQVLIQIVGERGVRGRRGPNRNRAEQRLLELRARQGATRPWRAGGVHRTPRPAARGHTDGSRQLVGIEVNRDRGDCVQSLGIELFRPPGGQSLEDEVAHALRGPCLGLGPSDTDLPTAEAPEVPQEVRMASTSRSVIASLRLVWSSRPRLRSFCMNMQ
jgi:hypothetical protein